MRDENGELQVPEFKSNIPEHLIKTLSEKERWQYEQISIQGQQNGWLIQRSIKADRRQNDADNSIQQLRQEAEQRFGQMDARLRPFEAMRARLTHRWSLFIGALTLIAIPAFLNFFLAWCEQIVARWFSGGKH